MTDLLVRRARLPGHADLQDVVVRDGRIAVVATSGTHLPEPAAGSDEVVDVEGRSEEHTSELQSH